MEAARRQVSARDTIYNSIRRSLGVKGDEPERRSAVTARLSNPPKGLIPQRGQLDPKGRVELFIRMLGLAAGTSEHVARATDVPAAVAAFLRANNVPLAIARGSDPRLESMEWDREKLLSVSVGPSDGRQLASVSHAFGAVAETGTLILTSGPDNPTTLNFLPDLHIVVVSESDIAGDYESVWARLRERFGAGIMPRTVNMITGPSRSADIGETLILGAHGPRRLHVIVVASQ